MKSTSTVPVTDSPRRMLLHPLAAVTALGLLAACACGGSHVNELPGVEGDLLAGSKPVRERGSTHPMRMTDGLITTDGDFWRTDLTSVVAGNGAVVWDLGKVADVSCGVLQGDNNDFYDLAGSEDGTTFTPLWTAEPVAKPGMQMRQNQHIDKRARYIRLTARGGDGFYSVGELALFGPCPKEWPPRLVAREGASEEESAQWKLGLFGLATVIFLFINRRGAADWVRLLVAVPVGLGISAFLTLKDLYPIDDDRGQTVIRAVTAAITIAILAREWLWPRRYPVHKKATAAALVLLSVVAVGCYYHFGMPQFRDEAKGRTTLVHPWDMRNYFPVAKYFDEVRYDGVYLGSVAAHLANHPGMNPDSLRQIHMRDLTTNEITTAGQLMDQILDFHSRFKSPERWELFKKDMKYFEDIMGTGAYLGSMQDHGGNATPLWMASAWLFWRNAPASEATLTATALIDPVLWTILFIVIARTFGTRVMLITLIAWGTTDFSRFGTNLMGSTLRADWMVALGLGACALKKQRWFLGGALLAYGGLIRAFPAFAALFLVVPPVWWIIDRRREAKRMPKVEEVVAAPRPALRAIAGAAAMVVVAVGLSSALFGFSASWGSWTKKISMHAEQPNSNHVGIRNLVSFDPSKTAQRVADEKRLEPWSAWQDTQRETFAKRRPLFYIAVLAFLATALVACRKLRLEQAAMLGLMMIPVFFYPANYYCHYVFLLPLLATREGQPAGWLEPERRTWFARVSMIILAMGIIQVPALSAWPDMVYTYQSIIILGAFALVLFPMAREAWRGLPPNTEDLKVGDDEDDEEEEEEDEEEEGDEEEDEEGDGDDEDEGEGEGKENARDVAKDAPKPAKP